MAEKSVNPFEGSLENDAARLAAEGKLPHPLTGELMPTPPDYLRGLPVILDITELTEDSFDRIMNAASPEEALFNPDSEGLLEYAGSVITIMSVDSIGPSTIRDHENEYFLRFTAATPKGVTSFTTGSPYAGRQLSKLHREGWLPRRVRVLELVSKSDSTRSSLWIVDAGAAVLGQGDEQPF